MNTKSIIVIIVLIISFIGCNAQNEKKEADFPELTGPYLGQKPPDSKAELFAPGIVSTVEYTEVLDQYTLEKGRLKFYRDYPNEPRAQLYNPGFTFEQKNGGWMLISPTTFFNEDNNPELSLIPDKNTIVFAHNRSINGEEVSSNGFDLWFARKKKNGGHEVRWLGPQINSKQHDSRPSMTKEGTIYFYSDREGGLGSSDIYKADLIKGQYLRAENLGHPVNTIYGEADPFVSKDGSYIVFCSGSKYRKGYGKSDLYVTFKRQDGSWSEPKNLGDDINSSANENRPVLTSDGKYMFFSRENNGTLDIYWADSKVIENLKPKN